MEKKKKKKTKRLFLVLFLDYHQKSFNAIKGFLFFFFLFFFITLESIKCYISKNIFFLHQHPCIVKVSNFVQFFNALHLYLQFHYNYIAIGKHGFYILNVCFYTGRSKNKYLNSLPSNVIHNACTLYQCNIT